METTTIPRARVWILNTNPGHVSTEMADALIAIAQADLANGWGFLAGKYEARSGANVSKARNDLVARFLQTDGEWALFLDSDMVPPADVMLRLLAAAHHVDTKVVGGLCVTIDDGPIPTIYQHDPDGVTVVRLDYPDDTLLQVAATGAACLLVHRKVLEAVAEAHPDEAFPWFKETEPLKGYWVSEDLEFCLRAGRAGYSIYVDTTTPIGHVKAGRVWWPSDIKTRAAFPQRPIVAVIPTKSARNPDGECYAANLVAQLVEQGEATEIVLINNADARLIDVRATVLDGQGMGIHEMWNLGASHTVKQHRHRAHIAFLNDDLRIGPGFLATMSRALDTDPNLAAISANYDHRPVGAGTLGLPHEPVQEVQDICAGRYDGTGGLAGFAFMVPATLFTSGYRFPEECKWWFGDNDLVRSILSAGGKIGIALRAGVEHLAGGGGTAGDWSDFAEQLAADRAAFEARWQARRIDPTSFEAIYRQVCETPSDINEHLPTLYLLALDMKAEKVIELGTRTGVSTVAWCHAMDETGGHVWTVDPVDRLAFNHPRLTFVLGDDLDADTQAQLPEVADIVFVDTIHSYEQTRAEIGAYKARVRSGGCMVFHDTSVERHEHLGADQPPFPTRLAVDEWVEAEGLEVERWENNNGLTVVRL